MQVEIWSDIVCPWCYIGKRRFERALENFEHADEVNITWRSFQLNPDQPRGARESLEESLAAKYGGSVEQVRAMNAQITELAAAEGLEYDFERYNVINTFDAHRLTQLAKQHGLDGALHERLLRAQLVEGEYLEDHEILVRLAAEVGVPEEESRRVLASDEFADDVEADTQVMRELGANGVPFFVIDRRYGISGAQATEAFQQALERAYNESPGSTAQAAD